MTRSSQARRMFWPKAFLAWLGFAVLAVACGAARVKLVEPLTGEPVAHVLGTLFVCALFLHLIHRFVLRTAPPGPGLHARSRLLGLGLFWTSLTVAFEFGFGHFVMGHPWERLLADYNLLAGRVWILVLLTLYAGPRLSARLMARRRA